MMTLLQCSWLTRSPSRNHTPGAIFFSVFGCASPRVMANPSASNAANPAASHSRKCFMLVDCSAGRLDLRAAGLLARDVANQTVELIGDFRQVFVGPTAEFLRLQPKLLR